MTLIPKDSPQARLQRWVLLVLTALGMGWVLGTWLARAL